MIELTRIDQVPRRWLVETVTIPLTLEGRMVIVANRPVDFIDATS